jgi:transcriptional regulator with XRE-family HTH domain
MTLTEVGIEVARARRARGLSQSDLARASALSRQTISALERGAIPDIGVRKLIRILEALDLDFLLRPAGHSVTLDDLRPGSP